MTKSQLKQEAERLSRSRVEISGAGVASKRSSDIVNSENARVQISAFRNRYVKKEQA